MRFRDGRRSVVNDVGFFVGGSASAMISRGRYAAAERRRRMLLAVLWQPSSCAVTRSGLKINQNDHFVGKLRMLAWLMPIQRFVAISSVLQVAN